MNDFLLVFIYSNYSYIIFLLFWTVFYSFFINFRRSSYSGIFIYKFSFSKIFFSKFFSINFLILAYKNYFSKTFFIEGRFYGSLESISAIKFLRSTEYASGIGKY